jgi:hypothetical protein
MVHIWGTNMGFNVNGALIETSQTALKITANSAIGLDTNASGFVTLTNRPTFVAYSTTGWNTFSGDSWNTLAFNSTLRNVGSCYSTSTNSFTAPVTGSYYFEHSSYQYKNPSSSEANYAHPTFWVNGSSTLRMASQTTSYRIRGRTYYGGNYSYDTQINDVLYLTAGDYVQVVTYCSGTQQWYGQYSHFTGFYIG